MTPQQRALGLLDRLYHAGVDDAEWPGFFDAFSDQLGGAAIAITNEFDDWTNPQEFFWVRLNPGYAKSYRRHVEAGLPWGELSAASVFERFCRGSDFLKDEQLADTAFYREWMAPQGLACEGPLLHAAPYSSRRPGWMLFLYRVEGARAFDSDDIELCDLLVPHLAACSSLSDSFSRLRRERVALSQVVDRLSTGILLVDARGRLLIANLAARRFFEANDGLALRDGVVRLQDADADGDLRRIIQDAIGWQAWRSSSAPIH